MVDFVYVKRTSFKALGILNSLWNKKGCVFFSENIRKPSTLSTSVSAFWNIYVRNQTLISCIQIESWGHRFFVIKAGSIGVSTDLEIQKVFCLPVLLMLPCGVGSGPRAAHWDSKVHLCSSLFFSLKIKLDFTSPCCSLDCCHFVGQMQHLEN